jgi:hypothetical protein
MRIKSLQQLFEDEIVPKNAARFAAQIVETVKEMDNIDLDYSVASLKHIDMILERFHREKGVTPRRIAVTLFNFGCYVGEVIVRNNRGARWISLPDDETESSLNSGLVVKLVSGVIANPIGKAEKRLLNGELDSIEFFYRGIVETDQESE